MWIEDFLVPELKPGQTLIAQFHPLQQAIDAAFQMYLIQSN
jgi:hypothetical protein